MSLNKDGSFTLNMTFPPESHKRIRTMQQESHSPDLGETISKSLELFEWYLRTKKDRVKIFTKSGNDVSEIEFVFQGKTPLLFLVK